MWTHQQPSPQEEAEVDILFGSAFIVSCSNKYKKTMSSLITGLVCSYEEVEELVGDKAHRCWLKRALWTGWHWFPSSDVHTEHVLGVAEYQ